LIPVPNPITDTFSSYDNLTLHTSTHSNSREFFLFNAVGRVANLINDCQFSTRLCREYHTVLCQDTEILTWGSRTAPQFLPRTKVANYLEAYAISQDLHVWTSSTLEAQPTYDADSKRWNATVIRTDASGNETKVVLRPKHLVMAIGNGAPRLPDIKGLKEAAFKGKWCHSSQHRDSKEFRGKKVVVVGAVSTCFLP